MPSLLETLTDPTKKQSVVRDCLQILDEEVASKSGISGFAIKAGFKAVQGIKPGFIPDVVEGLMPEFAKAIDPVYQDAIQSTSDAKSLETHLNNNASKMADALLSITDGRAERTKYTAAKATYHQLRGSAKKHVEAAVPKLSRLIAKYAQVS